MLAIHHTKVMFFVLLGRDHMVKLQSKAYINAVDVDVSICLHSYIHIALIQISDALSVCWLQQYSIYTEHNYYTMNDTPGVTKVY